MKDKINADRIKGEKQERLFKVVSEEVKLLRAKSDRLKQFNKDLEKEKKIWNQAKSSFQVIMIMQLYLQYLFIPRKDQ